MQDYPEALWLAFRTAQCPTITGEAEKLTKMAFLQGMYAGTQCVLQSTTLDNNTCAQFNAELKDQLTAGLARLGHRPGKINIGNIKSVGAGNMPRVNGHKRF